MSKLFKASLDTPVFHLEDIYITGVLARKVKSSFPKHTHMLVPCQVGIRPVDNIGFSYTRRKLNSCLFKQTVSTHRVKLPEMKAIHAKLLASKDAPCPTLRSRLLRDYGPGKCKWPKTV